MRFFNLVLLLSWAFSVGIASAQNVTCPPDIHDIRAGKPILFSTLDEAKNYYQNNKCDSDPKGFGCEESKLATMLISAALTGIDPDPKKRSTCLVLDPSGECANVSWNPDFPDVAQAQKCWKANGLRLSQYRYCDGEGTRCCDVEVRIVIGPDGKPHRTESYSNCKNYCDSIYHVRWG